MITTPKFYWFAIEKNYKKISGFLKVNDGKMLTKLIQLIWVCAFFVFEVDCALGFFCILAFYWHYSDYA